MSAKKRAINTGPDSDVGQSRKSLYSKGIYRIKDAIEHRYPLEAIALIESMIADRLEARLAHICGQADERRSFSTLGKLTRELCKEAAYESDAAIIVYKAVSRWADRRNEALHQLVKLAEGDDKKWMTRIEESQETAEAGLVLFREVDALVRKLNISISQPEKS